MPPLESESKRGVRARIAKDLEDAYDERISTFFTEALEAERKVWGTCSHCARRTEVDVPDWNARTRALQVMLDQGFGRPKSEDEMEPVTLIVERIWPIPGDPYPPELADTEALDSRLGSLSGLDPDEPPGEFEDAA